MQRRSLFSELRRGGMYRYRHKAVSRTVHMLRNVCPISMIHEDRQPGSGRRKVEGADEGRFVVETRRDACVWERLLIMVSRPRVMGVAV